MKHFFLSKEKRRHRCFLLLYGILMLWLLFGRGVAWQGDYWAQVQSNMNLIPFRTLKLYIHLLQSTHSLTLIRHAVVNLVGNVLMFVPLGLLLPKVYDKLRSGWRFFLTVILMICLVELVQLFTLVGVCDVDDLILNVMGAGVGFLAFKLKTGKS